MGSAPAWASGLVPAWVSGWAPVWASGWAPVLVSGGLRTPAQAKLAFERTGAAAVLLARGSLGNPWLFAQLLADGNGSGAREPTRQEILSELDLVIERANEAVDEGRVAVSQALYRVTLQTLRVELRGRPRTDQFPPVPC